MADFPANIQLTVDNSKAIQSIAAVERALNKVANTKLSPFERGKAAKAETEINNQLDIQAQKYAAIDRLQRQLLANDNSRIKANEKLSKTQQFIQDKISVGRARQASSAIRGEQNAYPTTIGPQPDFAALNSALEESVRKTQRVAQAEERLNRTRTEAAGRQQNFAKLQEVENKAKLEAARNVQRLKGEQAAHNRVIQESTKSFERAKQAAKEATKAENQRQAAIKRTTQANKKTQGIGAGTRGLLEGVGFPLLFGAGPGATALGGLGGFVGGKAGVGFGAQALGTALGAAIDNYVRGLAKLADSLESTKGVISGLEEAGYKVSDGVRSQIAVYQKAGEESKAYAAAIAEIDRILGPDGASKVSDYRVESEKLQQAYSDAKAALDAELLPAMTGFLRLLTGLAAKLTELSKNPVFREGAKLVGQSYVEGIASFVPGGGVVAQGFKGAQTLGAPSGDVQTPFEQTEAALATATKLAEQTEKQQRAEWEKADALRYQNEILALQIEAAKAGTDLADEAVYLARKRIIERETLNGLIENALNPLKREQIILEGTLKLLNLSNQRQAALNRPKRKGPKAPESKALQLQAQLIKGEQTRFDLSVQRVQILEGERAALQRQTAGLQARLEQELDIIDLKEKQALKNNKVKADEELIKATFAQQRDLAQDKLELMRLQNIEREKALNLARDLTEIEGRQAVEQLRTDLGRQIDDINFQTANPFGGPEVERLKLAAEQLYRYEDAMRSLANQEEKLIKQYENDPSNEVLAQNIRNVRDLRKVYEELLPALDAAEQKQLQLKQTLEMFQPVTDALAAGMADIFTSLIDGSKSAQEAFADMLKNMGNALIQTATTMIAQYIAIGIARIFAGMGSNGLEKAKPPSELFSGDFTGAFMSGAGLRASGGPVMANRPYVVGERGPELFLPHQSGYIQSNTASRASLPKNTASQPRTIRFETTMINNVEYVTKEEAIAIGRQAADDGARRGAKMGVSQTMSGLQNSRSQRAKLGMR